MPICVLCHDLFPVKIIINNKEHNLQRRKYCLKCSPFKKHNTRKLKYIVSVCFCGKATITGKKCTSCAVKLKRIRNKIAAIKYKGGHCIKCGRKCRHIRQISLFEFHHKENKKEFQISTNLDRKSWDDLKKELDSCDLLCSNCHREQHFELWKNKDFLRQLFSYDGPQDIWIKSKNKIRPFLR